MTHLGTPPQELLDRIASVGIRPDYSTQIELQSPFTGRSQIIDRGFPELDISVTIERVAYSEPYREEIIARIEAFLSSLEGAGNTFDLPHQRLSILRAVGPVTVQTMNSSDVLQTRINGEHDLPIGAFLRAGGRTFRVRSVQPGQTTDIALDPQRPIDAGTMLDPSSSIRVRATTTGPDLPHKPDWGGPWALSCREAS